MILVVRDPGKGFDPKTIPSPLQGERVFAEHGRGIYLINQLMDNDGGFQPRIRPWFRVTTF